MRKTVEPYPFGENKMYRRTYNKMKFYKDREFWGTFIIMVALAVALLALIIIG